MSTFKFIHTDLQHHQHYKVQMEIGGEITLADLLTEMEHFIRACGFNPKGTLEFIEDE